MTYYAEKVQEIQKTVYSKPYLTQQVRQAKLFMDTNFSENISLEEITRAACLSKFHCIRTFRNHYGSTPHQYLRKVRISQAKKLLAAGLPVAEVCYAVGFNSISSFMGLFKTFTGSTPGAYQNKVG